MKHWLGFNTDHNGKIHWKVQGTALLKHYSYTCGEVVNELIQGHNLTLKTKKDLSKIKKLLMDNPLCKVQDFDVDNC